MYDVVLTEEFLRSLRKIKNKALEVQVLSKLKELESNPLHFKPLQYDLKGYYRLRVGKLRVLYRVVGKQVYVEVLVKDHGYRELTR